MRASHLLTICTWYFKSLFHEIDFLTSFFVYFELDFCRQVWNRQNIYFKNQVQKSIISCYKDFKNQVQINRSSVKNKLNFLNLVSLGGNLLTFKLLQCSAAVLSTKTEFVPPSFLCRSNKGKRTWVATLDCCCCCCWCHKKNWVQAISCLGALAHWDGNVRQELSIHSEILSIPIAIYRACTVALPQNESSSCINSRHISLFECTFVIQQSRPWNSTTCLHQQ